MTKPAPASGDVVVPRELATELRRLCRAHNWVVEQTALETALASAPRPSGDVAAKLGEIRKLHEAAEKSIGTGHTMRCVPHDHRAYLLDRIATLEQERTARDAECRAQRIEAAARAILATRISSASAEDNEGYVDENWQTFTDEAQAAITAYESTSAPAGEIGEKLNAAANYMENLHSQGGGWQTGDIVRPALLRQAAARISSLEAELGRVREELALERAGIDDIASGLSVCNPYDLANEIVRRRQAAQEGR